MFLKCVFLFLLHMFYTFNINPTFKLAVYNRGAIVLLIIHAAITLMVST